MRFIRSFFAGAAYLALFLAVNPLNAALILASTAPWWVALVWIAPWSAFGAYHGYRALIRYLDRQPPFRT